MKISIKKSIISILAVVLLESFSACGGGGDDGVSTTAPAAPGAATITPGNTQLSLTWTEVSGATAYEVWYNTADNSTLAAQNGGDITVTTHVITGLTNGNTYYVWLKAKNSAGTSGFGDVASGTPAATITNVTFLSATQTGGTSGTADSTGLVLEFDADPAALTADNIGLTGATKNGALLGTGTTRTIAISNIGVANGATVSVGITSPAGYSITGTPQTAVVYRALYIGMEYSGGKIAYILQPGDPGYDVNIPHGIIAADEDQDVGFGTIWVLEAYWSTAVPGGTDTALGTGSANTDKIIAQNETGTGYAAGLARSYSGGGYTDWHLSSKDELNKLYLNRAAVGGFAGTDYWSSSEDSASNAWDQNFNFGSQKSDGKLNTRRVRAVRYF